MGLIFDDWTKHAIEIEAKTRGVSNNEVAAEVLRTVQFSVGETAVTGFDKVADALSVVSPDDTTV